jgi:hypothetical protein
LTGDVDVTVLLEPEAATELVAAMDEAGFRCRVTEPEKFARATRVLPFLHVATSLPLDIVLGSAGPEEEFVRTARQIDLHGTTVPVIAPEELIVTKILAGRAKDLDDVRGILAAQENALDLTRVSTLLLVLESGLGRSDLVPVLDAQLAAGRRSGA